MSSVSAGTDAVYGFPLPVEVSDEAWERERLFRYNCSVLTSLLRKQVPILDFVDWAVTDIEQGHVHTVLPLNSSSTNQHCTHQAAVFFLAADYTGGIALASLIPFWPVAGVHPVRPSEKPIALWLVKGEVKYLRPSVGRLTVAAKIDPTRHKRVRKQFVDGKPICETVTVYFRNGNVDVAEATMTYFARQSEKLRSDGVEPDKMNVLYRHKLISSAELIAGVRARESGTLFDDPYAADMAGEHGTALASRFCEKSPQLGGMVAARTRHLDLQIMDFVKRGGRDLALLGVGYDMRPFRLNLPLGMHVYELDLPAVLADRKQRLSTFQMVDPPGVQRIQVPLDLRSTTLTSALDGVVDFAIPIFVAWEGMSMYFEEPQVRAVLNGILPVLQHPDSRLWADFVLEKAVTEPDIFPEVAEFMQGMQLLGEPFVFGTECVEDFLRSNGFGCQEVVSSDVFFSQKTDPVYSIYHFGVASPDGATPVTDSLPDGISWVPHDAHAPQGTPDERESSARLSAADSQRQGERPR
jgi:methyltransferase (TIGR00027 family)